MTRTVWRIGTKKRKDEALSGYGALLIGGRWNPIGLEALYTSENLALSALEYLVHTDPLAVPSLVASEIKFPATLTITEFSQDDLPPDWRALPTPNSTQEFGRQWLEAGNTAVMTIPSIIIPNERNFVFNTKHKDFQKVVVTGQEVFVYDPRLL